MSLPMRGEWIEILQVLSSSANIVLSLPMRGEWIEIMARLKGITVTLVSPHAGRVD